MTEQDVQAIFDELRRIGVDLERPPGLALGTGFRAGEFLPWLRALPDALGHDAFVERLNATQLGSIEEQELGVRKSPAVQRRYLARRLMQVVRDHPMPSDAFDPWEGAHAAAENADEADATSGPASERRGNCQHARAGRVTWEFDGLAFRRKPSKIVQLGPRGDEPPALDAHAVCSECGATGTVAFVTREVEPLVSRYCADCWRRVRQRYWWDRPRLNATTPAGLIAAMDYMEELMREQQRSAGSALWEDRFALVQAMLAPSDDSSRVDRAEHAARLARQLVEHAHEMAGPMPPEVDAFVRQHAPPVG